MRTLFVVGGLLVAAAAQASAAPKAPVQWHVKAAPKTVKPGAKFNVTITGVLDPGWHLYALEEPQGGPVATEVALTEGDAADLIRVEEAKPRVLPDPLFQQPTGYFEGSADFTLHLQAAKEASATSGLRILVKYQSCNDRVCLPPHTDTITVPFTIAR
ncbi:protein-disulfide reductase DsbD N-terminal domain-containing protein [Granulicella arctica]|uniref:protein-disulfide reductase DsbD N-terminal domain-containing protein n=1 Tax=Granulicella arctica TaxID=940613 RepID=UPI0021E0862E|nr:protein-disulfide reductase DsbD N-terminal domain-containing protein [Granulicella arctica]